MAIAEPPIRSDVESDGDLVADFAESFCRITKGWRRGQLVKLEPFQLQILWELFELDPDTGRRRYRKALVGLPRKNAKSFLGSALALYLLTADGEPGAEVYSCAGDKEQAKIVFGQAKEMAEMDPDLNRRTHRYRDAIEDRPSGSVYKAVSAEAYTKEGLNPHGVIFDELHVQPNRELWDVMTLGSGTREQPLVVALTTAGFDKATICYELYDYGRKIKSGELQDPAFYFCWYEPSDEKADHRDPKVWRECNPALGSFLRETDLVDALLAPENVFRRYRLNQWTASQAAWLPPGAWDACKHPEFELDPELPVCVGIDIGMYHDAAAVVIAQRQPERMVLRCRIWENPHQVGSSEFLSYQLDVAEVREYLREIYQRFPAPASELEGKPRHGPEFSYDPAYFSESVQTLEEEGLAFTKFPQNESRMVPASQDFYSQIVEGKIVHDGDLTLARHIGGAVAKQTDRGWRLGRPRGKRIANDGAIAGAMAVHRALQPAPVMKRSAYEDHGLTSV